MKFVSTFIYCCIDPCIILRDRKGIRIVSNNLSIAVVYPLPISLPSNKFIFITLICRTFGMSRKGNHIPIVVIRWTIKINTQIIIGIIDSHHRIFDQLLKYCHIKRINMSIEIRIICMLICMIISIYISCTHISTLEFRDTSFTIFCNCSISYLSTTFIDRSAIGQSMTLVVLPLNEAISIIRHCI